MKILLLAIFLSSEIGAATTELPPPSEWERANRETRRLDPARVDGVPAWLVTELKRRRCLVPQSFSTMRPHNVIRGRLNDGPVVDWAVLCSKDLSSTILVFWDGKVNAVAELAPKPDETYLQVIGSGRIGFSRAIHIATPTDVRRYQQTFGGPRLSPLSHEGINDAFVEKASIVWYWHHGKWLKLQGAD
jgi:hypothetical protein